MPSSADYPRNLTLAAGEYMEVSYIYRRIVQAGYRSITTFFRKSHF